MFLTYRYAFSVLLVFAWLSLGNPCYATEISKITLPQKTITVFDVKITAPSITPPAISKFIYTGNTGVVTVSVLASVTPASVTNLVDGLIKWALATIPSGSVLTWGKTWPGDTTAGQSLSTTFTLTSYPNTNSEFGVRKLKLDGIRKGNSIVSKNEDVKFYYSKDATATGRTVPNWFFYWKQTGASAGAPVYDASTPYYGYYQAGDVYIHIGAAAAGNNVETGHNGIDTFAETCVHESAHMAHWTSWVKTALQDSDGDWLPDSVEDANGNGVVDSGETDPNNSDSDGNGIDDEDELCYKAEHSWSKGAADLEDWAMPGHQY